MDTVIAEYVPISAYFTNEHMDTVQQRKVYSDHGGC